jgi:hypothetical protein
VPPPPEPPPAYAEPPPAYAPPPPGYSEPPLPPAPDAEQNDGKFHMPPWSIRVDPFTWLIEGRLGFELEAGITKWLTGEIVPVFVTNATPPTLSSFDSRSADIRQSSNGLGPLSGTSLGLGFWLGGHAFHGYVLRAIFTDYGYTYRSRDETGGQDSVTHTDRWLMGMIGSHSTWGVFTLAGDFGLGVDLNHQTRCYDSDPIVLGHTSSSGCNGLELLTTDNGQTQVANVASSFYPVVIAGRISLGVTFE